MFLGAFPYSLSRKQTQVFQSLNLLIHFEYRTFRLLKLQHDLFYIYINMLCFIFLLMYVFCRSGKTLSFLKPRGRGSRRSLGDTALCNIVCTEQDLTSMWGCGAHNRCKAWCVFSKLKFFTATIQFEDSSQASQPQLSFFENPIIGFQLQARV